LRENLLLRPSSSLRLYCGFSRTRQGIQHVDSESGGMTEALTREMIRIAGEIAKDTGAYWTDQLAQNLERFESPRVSASTDTAHCGSPPILLPA
jgi:hypothetical protein